MSSSIFIGNPQIEVTLKRSTRAKRLTLRVSQTDGRATLTVPSRTSDRQASRFIARQEEWLRTQLAKLPERQNLTVGASILFRGVEHQITQTTGKLVHVDGEQVFVNPNYIGVKLQAFLKTQARDALLPAVEKYATLVNKPFNRFTLRDTRSRWGSCSAEGNLMFSWRLVMAPPMVLEYVAAHEVAHLVEMNHSSAFWDVVENLMPDYQNHRYWLRDNGAKLHMVDFTA